MEVANETSNFNQIQNKKLIRIRDSGNTELLETFEKKYKPIENKSWYEKEALLDEYINYLDTNTLPKKNFFSSFFGMGGKKSKKFRKFRKSRKSKKSKKSRKSRKTRRRRRRM
jgi:hypothetical protein